MNAMGAAIRVNRSEENFRSRPVDSEQFARIYGKFGRQLYGTGLRMLRNREDAEDVVQDTFITYQSTPPDVPESGIGPWLHRVLVNRCLDRLRHGKRWQQADLEERVVPLHRPTDGLRVDLGRAVGSLPEKARLVFLLHDVEGLKHREIAKLLEISEGTTKSQLSRARSLLRDQIESTSRGNARGDS